jgi:hypothetical protein
LVADVLVRTTATITATDSDWPSNNLRYSLAAGAPAGAGIDPVKGVFTWTPTRAQAATTNLIAVRVTDGGTPALSATKTFTVIVRDFSEITIGSKILQAGQTGSVPISVSSTFPLSSLNFSLDIQTAGLDEFTLQPQVALTLSKLTRSTPSRLDINLRSSNAQSLYGSKTVALLHFRALAVQPSAFIVLKVTGMSALRSGTIPVGCIMGNSGRVVYIGAEPLLEPKLAGTERFFNLYANPGVTCVVQHAPTLAWPTSWAEVWRAQITATMTPLSFPSAGASDFWRAAVLLANPPQVVNPASSGFLNLPSAPSSHSQTLFDW